MSHRGDHAPTSTRRPPKGKDRDRLDRQIALSEVLLPRLERDVLLPEERTLLAVYVREEIRVAEATRKSYGETTRALDRVRDSTDSAVQEAEQRAAEAKAEVEQWRATYGENALPDTLARLRRAEDAVARVRVLLDRLGPLAGRAVRIALEGTEEPACAQHPGAAVIGGVCGGCTVVPDAGVTRLERLEGVTNVRLDAGPFSLESPVEVYVGPVPEPCPASVRDRP